MSRKKQALHASGLVEVKVTISKTVDGKRIQKSFYGSSKLEAKKKADAYKLQQELADRIGHVVIKKEYTFSEWANKWLETKKESVKQSTYDATYKSKIHNYLIPYFGASSLQSIKQIDIQAFFNAHSKFSQSMQEKFKIILFGMFELAIDNDLCYKNPVKNIKMSMPKANEKRVYTKKDAASIQKYCTTNQHIDILLLLETGIRRSELLGLKWEDIDFEEMTIHITRAVTPGRGKPVESTPKSKAGNRFIPISKELVNVLKAYCGTSYIIKGHASEFMTPNGYSYSYKVAMQKICAALKIEVLNPHELRHTFGTLLRERGVDIYTIQKLMGHSNIETTAHTYIHNDIDVLRKAMGI